MDLIAKYLSETCLDPIEYLHQLRQTTEPIGGGTEYCEDGELVEYDVAIEAIKKATDAFKEKACEFMSKVNLYLYHCINEECDLVDTDKFIEDFKKYMDK